MTFLTSSEISKQLKSATGYNSRQVSIRAKFANTSMVLTVRCAKVDVKKVRQFAASIHTGRVSEDDCSSGQFIRVEVDNAVRVEIGAKHMDEIKAAVAAFEKDGGTTLSNGLILWRNHGGREFHVASADNTRRGHYVNGGSLEGAFGGYDELAYHMATV